MPESDPRRTLELGLAQLKMNLAPGQHDQLLEYLELLLHWNRAYNLIAVAPRDVLVARHLLDSLAVLPYLQGESAADLGTGAGLPGIPLAIAAPERRWMLVDSAGKRIRFLRHVCRELELPRVQPWLSRIEQWQPETPPQALILRAVTAPPQALQLVRHLAYPGLRVYLMMGRKPAQELQQWPAGYSLRDLVPLRVPFVDGERHLAVIECNDAQNE
ncbi:MAG: 16S rRNA (guanine(527)-N(7))-methyltransferase RsmG [Wenzhouxiangellaceae bacterium]